MGVLTICDTYAHYILIPSEDALRVDANISVRLTDADQLGTRTEVKNIQSWKSLSKAIGKIKFSMLYY